MMVAYHPAIHILDFLTPRAAFPSDTIPTTQARVAVLYTVCDDFDSIAFKSCVQAARQVGGQVYVLDDSRQEPMWDRIIDALQENGLVHIVRREYPRAFKAGNINDAIKTQLLHERYDYIILADADEILPPSASATLAATLDANSNIAFVQLAHASRADEASWFAKVMRVMTDVKYRYYRKYTNQYGLPLSHGHGVAIRLALLKHGLPEIISEDIAMSIDLRQAGYRGLFLTEPLCQESAVRDLATFCRRERRCMAADVECFACKVLPMIIARGIGLIEKWDLFVRELRYPIKLLFPLTTVWAVLSSISGWPNNDEMGLTGPVSKACWVSAALIPWASYFRFLGIQGILPALDFLLVSLPTHIGCMIVYLEGAVIGLWRAIQGGQLMPEEPDAGWIWIPTRARGQNTPSILGDLLRYLTPGLVIATVGATWSQWELTSIGACLIAQWIATRQPLGPKVGSFIVRVAGCGMILALLMYVVSPSCDYVSDLGMLSLAVIIF